MVLPQRNFDPENAPEPIDTIGSVDETTRTDFRLSKSLTIYLKTVELYDDKYDFF